jgi:hypothetical protein
MEPQMETRGKPKTNATLAPGLANEHTSPQDSTGGTAMNFVTRPRFLAFYSAFLTLALVAVAAAGFAQQNSRQKFGEIDVERINVVEPDGTVRIVISNKADEDHSVALKLRDGRERDRIVIRVDPEGAPLIQLLDARGKTVRQLPEPAFPKNLR